MYGKEWGAHQAIDGKFSKYGFGYFHSAVEPYPWLMIRLNKGIILSGITIHNRHDCCGDRLKAIEIRAGEELIDEDHSGPIEENTKCGQFDGPGETGFQHNRHQKTFSSFVAMSCGRASFEPAGRWQLPEATI